MYADETVVKAAQLMTPEMANFFGTVHGGEVLKLVDNIAYVCAARFAGEYCVTAAVDRVDFHHPVPVGTLLHVTARVCYAGRTSVEVEIDLHAEDIHSGETTLTNTCHFTMVAMKDGRPTLVPKLVCRTREDKARYIQAKRRRELGLKYREERDRFLEQFDTMDDTELDALIASQDKGGTQVPLY
jgi:uncharacterized protein (TIGR00369 family)